MAEDFKDKRLCPLMLSGQWTQLVHDIGRSAAREVVKCHGKYCAWYDQTAERCAVLSIARNK